MVIAASAVIITGRFTPNTGIPSSGDYRPDLPDHTGFDLVVRGYRMDEVDAKIADLNQEITALKKTALKKSMP